MNNNFKILFGIVMEFSRIFKNEALKQCIRTFDSVGQRENGTLFSFSFHSCARFWEHFDEIFFFHLSIYKWNDREDESAQNSHAINETAPDDDDDDNYSANCDGDSYDGGQMMWLCNAIN